ncbi:MAG: penicillin-binding protein 1C [bacterium]
MKKIFCLFIIVNPLTIFLLLNELFPLPADKLHPTVSTIILDRNDNLLRAFLAGDDMWRIPVSVDEISPTLKKAVLTYEDKYFYRHFGINPISIIRAARTNLRSGRIVQGGSTLTMQVARLLEPKSRSYLNKLKEAFRALQLEWRYSKDEILAFYFNMAPYGGNLVGVGAASYAYFKKSPDKLSLGEAAILAAVPNSPNRFRADRYPNAAKEARAKVLRLLQQQNQIDAQQRKEAQSEPVPAKRFALPFEIPHLSTELHKRHPFRPWLTSTIDRQLQIKAESILQTHLKPLQKKGIYNGAVVIIENRTHEVLAMVGSPDFFDNQNQGQVNGAMSPRSPGSALKPFVYALGLEQGVISPSTLLKDVPVEYAGYRPVNYDERFHGAVSVQEALVHSLNVPAVNLYAELGDNGVYSFLKRGGISTLPKPKEYYGLSLILGGGEVTLLELTNLYAGLASGGNFTSYRLLKSDAGEAENTLLSPGTCFILTDILSQLRRPELPAVWESTLDMPKVAWKTGTSYGHRDAWSIGYTPQLTIGVWVGNFDGRGVPELVGAEAAAPILFALFNALEERDSHRWFVQPESVEMRQVCAVSGMPVSQICAAVKNELFLPGVSPNQTCTIHQRILVDRKTGQRLCSHCRIGRTYWEKVIEHWPAEISSWKMRNGQPLAPFPEHFQKCVKIASGEKPVIHSPAMNTQFKIRSGVSLKYQKILLQASVSNHTHTIYWFMNGRLIYSGDPNHPLFITPQKGRHTLLCMDEEGRSSEVEITIN